MPIHQIKFNTIFLLQEVSCVLCLRRFPGHELEQLTNHLVEAHNCTENLHLLTQMAVAAATSSHTEGGFYIKSEPGQTEPSYMTTQGMIKSDHSMTYTPCPPPTPSLSDNSMESWPSYNSYPSGYSSEELPGSLSTTPQSSSYASPQSSAYTSPETSDLYQDISELESLLSPFECSPRMASTPAPPPIPSPSPQLMVTPTLPFMSRALNRNKYLVSQDLKHTIITTNPHHHIDFVNSQRRNTQMVLNGFLLKKTKGPNMTRAGRAVHWRCAKDGCRYTAHTVEGRLNIGKAIHDHPIPFDLVLSKMRKTY